MKKILTAFAVMMTAVIGMNTVFAASFSDVPSSSPYYAPIESLKNLGIVSGYSDGTFKPDQSVNRAEALKMILASIKVVIKPGLFEAGFPDVPLGSWFSGYVLNGAILGIVKGNPDGTFAPQRTVNKAEFIKMSVQAYKIDLTPYKTLQTALSKDIVTGSDWFFPYFNYAKTMGVTTPNLKDELQPGKSLSRAECAEIIYKMYILKNGGQTQEMLSAAEGELVDALVQIKNNNLEGALKNSDEAVFYAENAVKKDPKSNITLSALDISHAFQDLFRAYKAGTENNSTELKSLAEQAKTLADSAVQKNAAMADLANQIKTLADTISKSA